MLKRLLITLLLLMLLPTTAFAHSGLKSSTPNDKEMITKPINEIVMEFNTNIEKLSTFTLLDKNGQKINIDNMAVEGEKLTGTFKDPLPNGDYTVNWKIIGEDGHVIERSFTFIVKMSEVVKDTPTSTPQPTEQVEQTPAPYEEKQTVEAAPSQMTLIWTGVGALLVIVVLVITMRRRK
jgi:methionine-rich copper-binding protein CopC